MVRELVERNAKLARVVHEQRPDVLAGVGGIFVSHVGFMCRVPSVVFYDTENATLQNFLTFPLASRVVVPRCYRAWTPPYRTVRYAGYHELAYLSPDVFFPDRETALACGLSAEGDTFLIRVVSWRANHDIGERGWSAELLHIVVDCLAQRGKVVISAECELPSDLQEYGYRGPAKAIHHLLAHCKALVGESATMCSEAAVLGVPSIYIADTSRGYIDEQASRYGLTATIALDGASRVEDVIDEILSISVSARRVLRRRMLKECADVPSLVADQIVSTSSIR